MQRQIIHQTQFISSVTGGPVEYSGGDMRAAHEEMSITKEDTIVFGIVALCIVHALVEPRFGDVAQCSLVHEQAYTRGRLSGGW